MHVTYGIFPRPRITQESPLWSLAIGGMTQRGTYTSHKNSLLSHRKYHIKLLSHEIIITLKKLSHAYCSCITEVIMTAQKKYYDLKCN